MPNRVVHFEVPATNLKRALDFYTEAFGWKMQKQGEEYGGYVVAMTGPEGLPKKPDEIGINGGIYEVDKKDVNAYRCVIGVDDIEKAVKEVKTAGGKVYDDNKTPDGKELGEIMDIPGVGKWAKCEDTEGNLFSILQPAPGDWMTKE